MRHAVLIAAALIAAVLSAPAIGQAEAADALRAAVLAPKAAASAPPAVSLTLHRTYAEAYALRQAGMAKTAVSQTDNDVTGSLGFLCGLQPGQKASGPASARGYDPNGRFLGAKLSIALR